jgi:hypothetical protein
MDKSFMTSRFIQLTLEWAIIRESVNVIHCTELHSYLRRHPEKHLTKLNTVDKTLSNPAQKLPCS